MAFKNERSLLSYNKTGNGQLVIGITTFAQRELGDIVFAECNITVKNIRIIEVFGTIKAVKTVSEFFCPIEGIILKENPHLSTSPKLANTDPYGSGWIIRMEPNSPEDLRNNLQHSLWNSHSRTTVQISQ